MKDKMFCKKNAFTLVEIIAAVIVMGIIAIIAVPSVIRYINDSTETTYLSYENSMEDAAKNHVIKCVDENNPNCLLPEQGEKKLVYLSDLVNSGYIDDMKDPKSDNFCESEISYVEIANSGNTDFEYTACLYCGQYKTKDAACTLYSNDSDDPVCGIVTGDSTRWTNTNRKITVECSDKSSGCISNTFSKTFNSTVKESYITIADKSGRTKNCPVNVYVDKTLPTCELEVTKGQLESSGWYSGEVEVTLKNQKDNESGLLTYGIGTSINNRNYNKETKIKVNDGITTVIGYVKDKAGNEGVCSLDVRVGEAKPEYFIEYGYQIYPDKETYTVSGMTQTGNTFTATSNDPQIAFTGLNNYKSVNRVVVYFETPVANNSYGQVFYSNGTHSDANSVRNVPIVSGSSKVEFVIPKGTYNNIRIDLGSTSGLSYNIRRIELRVGDRSVLWTNKDVSVVLLPEAGRYNITEYSFDNGATWQTKEYKEFSSNNSNIVTKAKNYSGLVSDSKIASITNIDKVKPTVTITAKKKTSGTVVATNSWSTEGLNFILTSGNVGISGATIYYCQDRNNTCNPTTTVATGTTITALNTIEDTYYVRYKVVSGAGTNSDIGSYTAKVDIKKPTVTSVSGNPTIWTNQNVTLTVNGAADNTGGSGLQANAYSFDNGVTWQAGNTKTYTANTNNIIIKVRDNAGNIYTHSAINVTKIDKSNPTVIVTAKKKTSGTVVATNSWSTEGLNFILTSGNVGISGATIYYCQDRNNTCNPTTTVATGTTITSLNTTEDTYYVRYKVVSGAGTSSEVGSYTAKVDIKKPTVTSVSGNPTTWTNQNVTLTINGAADNTGGSGLQASAYSFDNGATWQTGNTKTYTSNTNNIIIKVRDNAGNVYTHSTINITKIDKSNPTVSIVAKKKTSGTTVATNTWSTEGLNFVLTSGNVGISGATIYYCQDRNNTCNPTTTVATGTTITSLNTTEDTYYVRYKVVSGAGTISAVGSYTAKVDIKKPTVTSVSGNPTTWTNQNVTLTINGAADNTGGSGLQASAYSFDNGVTWQAGNTKTYTANSNNIIIKVRDNVGNIYTHSAINITKIDKIAPTITSVSGNPTAWTNQNVTLTVNGAADNTGGSGLQASAYSFDNGVTWQAGNTKTYTANTNNIIIKVRDNAGNIYTNSSINITKIDKIAPTCTSSGDSTSWTNSNRTIYYGCSDSNSGCNSSYSGGSQTFSTTTKTASISAYEIRDNAGNVTSCPLKTVNVYVDKIAPTCTNSGDSTSWTNSSRTIYYGCSDSNSGCNSSYSGGSRTVSSSAQTVTISAYEIRDNAGNSVTCPARTAKTYVDKNSPTCSFSYETKEWTNKKIGVTFSARDIGGSKIAYYTYTFLGSTTRFDVWNNEFSSQQVWGNTSSPVVFRVYDAAGNSGSCTLSISNVDQEKPTCTMSISPSGWTNGSVTATINGTDSLSGISSYQFNYDGGWSSSNKKTITSESGSSGSFIYGYVKDRARNQNESACIGTYKIDKTAPSCSITASGSQSNGWYTGDVTLKSTYSDALSGVGSYGMGAFSSAVYNSLNEVTRTGDTSGLTFKCFVKDNAGNTASRSITIKKDSTKPTCSWTHGSWGTTTTATITGSDATSGVAQINAGDGYKSGSSTTKKFTSAGTHTGFVKDKAGNTNTCSITISKRTRYRQRSCSTCSSCSSAGYNYGSWTSDGGGCYGSNMSSSYPKSSATNLVAYDSCVKQVGTGRGCKVGQYYCKKYKRTRTAKSSCSACGCSSWGSWTGYNYDSCSASSTATSKKECESREEYR